MEDTKKTINTDIEDMRRKYEFIVNASKLSMTLISSDYTYEAINDSFVASHKKSREEIIGNSVGEVWGEETFKEKIKAHLDKCFAGNEEHYQEWFNFGALGLRYIDVRCYPYYNDEGIVTNAAVISHDITEHKLVEDENVLLATAIESASNAVVITDTNGAILYVNSAFEQITGYKREEAINKKMNLLKSGKQDKSFYKEMWDTITNGKVWAGSLVNMKKDGTLFSERLTISPVNDSTGKRVNYIAVKRDITKELELEAQLHQSQKLESIGTLAGGIAHDFNNILASIIGYSELTIEDMPAGSRARANLEEVLNAGNRAKELVRQILAFSRKNETKYKPLHLSSIVKETLKLIRATLPATIKIQQNIDLICRPIVGDETQIQQVMMNLCINAEHAMDKHGGILQVSLEEVDVDKNLADSLKAQAGHYIRLTIADTGGGMTDDVMDKIFDPFFTTKEVGKGTGMGLSAVHGIVKSHGGMITVSSEVGKGSTFHVFFPETKIVNVPDKIDVKPNKPHRGNESILFIDDEITLANMGKYILMRSGYKVEIATDSLEALEIFRSQPDRFDIVITDVTMPDMTGHVLAKEILHIRPDIPIIFCTGSIEEYNTDESKEMGVSEYVMKPVDGNKLTETIRKVLETKSGKEV
ncbi:MAG: PAS domain S-box protein [Candidatus Anammoxibacter sp.]